MQHIWRRNEAVLFCGAQYSFREPGATLSSYLRWTNTTIRSENLICPKNRNLQNCFRGENEKEKKTGLNPWGAYFSLGLPISIVDQNFTEQNIGVLRYCLRIWIGSKKCHCVWKDWTFFIIACWCQNKKNMIRTILSVKVFFWIYPGNSVVCWMKAKPEKHKKV